MDLNDDENIEWLMESSKTVENVGVDDADLEQREQDSIELYRFLQVLRSCFENEPILIESKAKGTVKCEEDFQKLIKKLKVLGYFFSIRTSEKKVDRQNCKLMIVNKKTSSHPYRVISHTRYYCSQKNKEMEETNMEKAIQSRKYTNCKAIMDIREVETFTSVCLSTVRRKRIEMLKKFRRTLLTNPHPEGEIKYCVIISLPKTHNHPHQVKGQYLNDEVKAAMHYVLRTGTTSVEAIQEKLYQIVDREFQNDSIKPSRENSAFYPNQKTIYNHLRRDGLVMKKVYKKNGSELQRLKNKTKMLLNSVINQIEGSSDTDVILKVYKRTQNMAKLLGDFAESEEIDISVITKCNLIVMDFESDVIIRVFYSSQKTCMEKLFEETRAAVSA